MSSANEMIQSYGVRDRCFPLGDLAPLFFFASVIIEKREHYQNSVGKKSILKFTSTTN